MKLKTLLEAPLADVSFHGDETASNFSASDMKVIKKFVAKKIYHEKLKKVPCNLYVYVVSDAALEEVGMWYPEGEIFFKADGTLKNFSTLNELEDGEIEKIFSNSGPVQSVFAKIHENKKKDPKGVHFILGDNYSATDQMPVTAWILMHRFGHTFTTSGVNYDKMYDALREFMKKDEIEKLIGNAFGIKSLKHGKSLDPTETGVELLTKYLISGQFEPDEDWIHKNYEADTAEDICHILDKFAESHRKAIDYQVQQLPGRTFYI